MKWFKRRGFRDDSVFAQKKPNGKLLKTRKGMKNDWKSIEKNKDHLSPLASSKIVEQAPGVVIRGPIGSVVNVQRISEHVQTQDPETPAEQ